MTGTVKFIHAKGYGFVTPDDGSKDVFFHISAVQFKQEDLCPGTLVKFETEQTDRGLAARNVRF